MPLSTPLRRLSIAGVLVFFAFGTMAPTCGKDEKKPKVEESDDEDDDSSSSSSKSTAAATVSAEANMPPEVATNVKVGDEGLFKDEAAVVEAFDDGSAAFVVDHDGSVKVALAAKDGTPLTDKKVKLVYEEAPNKFVDVVLVFDPEKKIYVGRVPELTSTITPIQYEIVVGAKPWKGILQLPSGGTKELVVTAKVAADVHAKPVEGPHGGRIERIGGDDVEVLIDPDSGETRAWIIVEGRAVPPRDRSIAFYIDDRYVEAYPDQNDSFYAKVEFSAGFSFSMTRKVSVALSIGEHVHTCLFGFRPHVSIYAFRPIYDVRVVGWTKHHKIKWDKNPNEPGLGWAKGKDKHGGKFGNDHGGPKGGHDRGGGNGGGHDKGGGGGHDKGGGGHQSKGGGGGGHDKGGGSARGGGGGGGSKSGGGSRGGGGGSRGGGGSKGGGKGKR